MTDILPNDYLSGGALPPVLGQTGSTGSVLQMSYANGSSQLLSDQTVSSTATVKVTGYTGGRLDPEGISFYYQPANTQGAESIPLDVIGIPELQEDGSYLVTTEIPALGNSLNGHLVASYFDGATSDGLEVIQTPYPPVPEELLNDGASRQVLMDYENLTDSLAPPSTRSMTGTVQSSFSKKGLNALENKDDIKRKEAIQGAVQQAVSRIRGLSEVLAVNHLGDEVVKMQIWLTAIARPDFANINILSLLALGDITDIIEYAVDVTQDVVKLTNILEQYSIGLKGSTAVQNSGVVNQSAQAFRYTSNSVFDIEAPTTLINTEYLVQQSTKSTFRQTGIDQLSCFTSWHRAEDGIIKQARNHYNYATDTIYNGAKVKVGTYLHGVDHYLNGYSVTTGPVATGSSYSAAAADDIDFFSLWGSFLVRVFKNIAGKALNFVIKTRNSIFMQAQNNLALEAKGEYLHLVNKEGYIVIDAKEVIFRTDEPVKFFLGQGPSYYSAKIQPTTSYITPPYDLTKLPHLSVIDLMEPGSILAAIPDDPLYIVEAAFTTIPEAPQTIIPPELLDYPKAPTGGTVPQPDNGVIFNPVYPSS